MNPKHGGPSQGIRNSVPALKIIGVDNEVVCLDSPDEEFLKQDEFTIHAIGASKSSWAYNSTLPSWLKQHYAEYDVVIIHGLWLYHSYVSVKTILNQRENNSKPKVYIMPHGMLDPWFQKNKNRKIKALRNEAYWRLIERNVVNSSDGLLFTCEQELLLARDTFKGYRPKRELNVSYGVQSPPLFTDAMKIAFRSKNTLLSVKPYLLFLSRIHPKKGVDMLVSAYIKLQDQNLNLPDLVIAGPIEGEYSEKIIAMCKSSLNIHFTGMLQGAAKWGAFYGCEAFILPSHQENFGISVVEALACSKPVLISNQVNIYKEIEVGGAGLIESDTIEGIENLLLKWTSLKTDQKNQMSNRAKEVYLRHYSIDQTALTLKQALQS